MKCDNCKFDLPDDWPEKLCTPCQHARDGIGMNRTDIMTPWTHC